MGYDWDNDDNKASFIGTVGGTVIFFYIVAFLFAGIYRGLHRVLDWVLDEKPKQPTQKSSTKS
jgi:hypothetical protein